MGLFDLHLIIAGMVSVYVFVGLIYLLGYSIQKRGDQ